MDKRVHITLGPLFPLFVRARNAGDLKYSKAAEVMPSYKSVLLVTVFFAAISFNFFRLTCALWIYMCSGKQRNKVWGHFQRSLEDTSPPL